MENKKEKILKIRGWQINHKEKLLIQANTGASTVRLRFFYHPTYHQTV